MRRYSSQLIIYLVGLCILASVSAISFASDARAASPTAGSTTVTLDDGSTIAVDYVDYSPVNVSLGTILANGLIQTLVLAADRSTATGCPYYASKKGLFKTGDHIFVTNNYIAWFDYTLSDGIGNTRWARSGGLAGFWSLNASSANPSVTFRYFYDPTQSQTGNTPNSNGLCWNWARNELIPGSDSPGGTVYFWDTYAPPVEHTIVFETAAPTSTAPATYSLFSTDYPQGVSGSQFTVGNTGWWDGTSGTHYTTAGLLASAQGGVSFSAINAATGGQTASGQVSYVLDYDCQENGIQVIWDFSSTVTIVPYQVYVDVWAAYAGLNQSKTCGEDPPENIPPVEFGLGSTPYHTFNYVVTSIAGPLALQTSLPTGNLGSSFTTNPTYPSVSFPWTQAQPCNTIPFNVAVFGTVTSGSPPVAAPIPQSTSIVAAYSSSANSAAPYMSLTNMVNPQQTSCNWPSTPTAAQSAADNPASGTCPKTAPASFPLYEMQVNYEHSDQQQGLILQNTNTGQALVGGQWYMISYTISTIE